MGHEDESLPQSRLAEQQVPLTFANLPSEAEEEMKMQIRRFCALLLAVATLDSFAGERIVRLEPTSRLDTETTEFRRIDLTGWNTVGMNLSFGFANAVSNNVEIAIGHDDDGNGVLSFCETDVVVGWDVGNYYIEYVPDGTRYEESADSGSATEHWLDCQIRERRHQTCGLEVTSVCDPLFAELSATLPPWLYDANWNLVRLTTRGVACDAVFKIEVVSSGVLLIVN